MQLYDYFRSSAAYRVRIALNFKGLAPERAFVHLRSGAHRGVDYLAMNPQGLVPALVTDAGDVLTQSLAIIEWLDETHPEPPLLPPDAAGRARVRALALAIACDIHPLNNLRVLNYLTGTLGATDAQKNGWYRYWCRRWFRSSGDATGARSGDRPVLSRQHADARRHLPRPAACQWASRRPRPRALSDAPRHRGGVHRAAGVCSGGAVATARCRVSARAAIERGSRFEVHSFTCIAKEAMTTVFPAWEIPTVPIVGRAERFPVRHIYCVGRNYAEHAKEAGGDPTKEPPFFFTKPADAVVPVVPPAVGRVRYPLATKNYHHEIELVVAIGAAGVRLEPGAALAIVWGYAVGLDMTRRDLQGEMRERKRPWDIGKSFAEAAPIGPISPVTAIGHPARGGIWLDVNGTRRQQGDLTDMIWDVPHTIAFLSQYYELLPGDLIFTGTPAGVGAVVAGDRLDGGIDGLGTLSIEIVPPTA